MTCDCFFPTITYPTDLGNICENCDEVVNYGPGET